MRISLFLTAAWFVCAPAYAQDAAPERGDTPVAAIEPQTTLAAQDGDARVYTPDYFTRFAPKTALDMVRQIPGFSIEQAEQRRGLGQGGGNVLINGKRFSGKSNDAVSALGRISANSVIRIELLDGASIDIPGLSGQVVNIVSETGGVTGQFRWSPRYRPDRPGSLQLYDAEASVSGQMLGVDYTLSLQNNSFRFGTAGPEIVTDGFGRVTDRRDEALFVDGERPKISASFKRDADNGNIANLNLAFERPRREIREDSRRIFDVRDFFETENEYNYEVGGDYEFGLVGGRLKLIGLHSFEHSPFFTRVLFTPRDGSPILGSRQQRVTDETETIARGEYSWNAGGADWQISLEGALNGLANGADLAVLNPTGDFVPIPLLNADAEVDEQRAEAALTYGRPLSNRLTLQASLGGEYSRISQSGPAGQTRSFYRPKGFVSLAWKPAATLDIQGRIARVVGQLNFFDFVASADIGAGNQNAANPNLVPSQSWELELEATQDFGTYGSLTAKGIAQFVEDIVDQVPIGATGEAPGNIPSATIYGTSITGTLRFDPLGWAGARLDVDASFRNGTLEDPLTGLRRRISNSLLYQVSANFRQDVPGTDIAYGASYNQFEQARGFRLGELSRSLNTPGDLGLFVEHKDVFGLTVRGGISNLLATNERFTRTVFTGRRTGPVAFIESRDRYFGPVFSLDVSGSF